MSISSISNKHFIAEINHQGAELKRLFFRDGQYELIWPGDPSSWNRSSPVLFPIVGRLKGDFFLYDGKKYEMPQHGFARDREFRRCAVSEETVSFVLKSDSQTLLQYPWEFELKIEYVLNGNSMFVNYRIENLSSRPMYYSIGAHPAIRLPLFPDSNVEDYHLEFPDDELLTRVFLQDGLITNMVESVSEFKYNKLPITRDMFKHDAMVFRRLKSKSILLKNRKQNLVLKMAWENAAYFGLWSKPGANFICLEPWNGIADHCNSLQLLREKEGILFLLPKCHGQFSWSLNFDRE